MGVRNRSADRTRRERGDPQDDALRALSRRPLTERELRESLARRGHEGAAVEAVLLRLGELGYVDDLKLSVDYVLARTGRLGHGEERLRRELEERGVAPETARRAWLEAVGSHGLDPEGLLAREVERRVRLQGGRLDLGGYRRVYNALLRAGFESSKVRAALDPHRAFDDLEEGVANGTDDELP